MVPSLSMEVEVQSFADKLDIIKVGAARHWPGRRSARSNLRDFLGHGMGPSNLGQID